MRRFRNRRIRNGLLPILFLGVVACTSTTRGRNALAYPPDAFSAEVLRRAPGLPPDLTTAPYAVDPEVIARSRQHLRRAPRGQARIEALVAFLSAPEPDGLGLVYDFAATGTATRTLSIKRGNCVSLAMVLVGIARGLGWPAYFVEVRARRPETQEYTNLKAVSDHMAVVIPVSSYTMIVDFTGRVSRPEDVRLIDDVTAYAHVMNNLSARSVLRDDREPDDSTWDSAIQGFALATRLQPKLGRAWNNLGIALTHRGRFEEARASYQRAVELDTAFGSAEHNLTIMETRAEGAARIQAAPLPEARSSKRDGPRPRAP